MGDEWTINSEEKKKYFLKHFEEQWEKHNHLTVKIRTGKQRTLTQNAAMHKYFTLVSDELNNQGQTVDSVHSNPIEMEWTPMLVKDLLWRKIQLAKYPEIESTSKLQREQVSDVYETLSRFLAKTLGINIQFPHKGE